MSFGELLEHHLSFGDTRASLLPISNYTLPRLRLSPTVDILATQHFVRTSLLHDYLEPHVNVLNYPIKFVDQKYDKLCSDLLWRSDWDA